ncbi:TPA: hypothetical protein DIU27_04280 [Candidatus Collierbacteria bacterium]|nr:hypothetical protein [Candidatus Collierbacteria bacterium]
MKAGRGLSYQQAADGIEVHQTEKTVLIRRTGAELFSGLVVAKACEEAQKAGLGATIVVPQRSRRGEGYIDRPQARASIASRHEVGT